MFTEVVFRFVPWTSPQRASRKSKWNRKCKLNQCCRPQTPGLGRVPGISPVSGSTSWEFPDGQDASPSAVLSGDSSCYLHRALILKHSFALLLYVLRRKNTNNCSEWISQHPTRHFVVPSWGRLGFRTANCMLDTSKMLKLGSFIPSFYKSFV